MTVNSIEQFETDVAAMPDVPERGAEEGEIAKSDLEKASEVFGMVEKLDGDPDTHMADLVRSANEFASAQPGNEEALGEAKIADEAGAYKLLEGGDVDDTARTLGEQPVGPLKEALSEISAADPSGEAVGEITGVIDRYALASTGQVEASILGKLQPGFAKEQRFVTSATHAESHGEKGATSNNERIISAHLSRLEELSKKVGLEKIFQSAVKELVIKPEEIPDSYYTTQAEILRDNGQGGFDLNNEETRRSEVEAVQDAQRKGLESWAKVLQEGNYPTWFKFYAWDGMSKLATFNYDKGVYNKRSSGTTTPYPHVNEEALDTVFRHIQLQLVEGQRPDDMTLARSIEGGNFNKIYSHALLDAKAIVPTPESIDEARNGEWAQYNPTNLEELMAASEGTPWCTAGERAAAMYLSRPEAKFYMYHMKDKEAGMMSSTACASIRMENGVVAEVSGIAGGTRQILEGSLTPIVLEKVMGLPGGEKFLEAYNDKEKLKSMDRKMKSGEDFTLDELKTLYEIDRQIQYSIPDEKQINDPRPDEFKADKSKHIQQLREEYGDDAEWLTDNIVATAERVRTLLEGGADPNLLFNKLEVGPTWHPQNKVEDATLLLQQGMTLRAYTYNLDLFVQKGLKPEICQKLYDERPMINLSSITKAFLQAGLNAGEIFQKVLKSPNRPGIVYDCIEDFAARGIAPEDIARAVINESGAMVSVHKALGEPSGPFDFDYEVVEENPIQRLVAIGANMTQFAEYLDVNDLKVHYKELADLGINVESILANKKQTEATDPAWLASDLTGGWVLPHQEEL